MDEKREDIFEFGRGGSSSFVDAAEVGFELRANEFGLALVRPYPTMRVWARHFFLFFFEFRTFSRANVY
jgi:hypothetical protein